MSDSEKLSDESAEKVSSEDRARHSTSGIFVAGALFLAAFVLICVLVFWTSSSSSAPAAAVGSTRAEVKPGATAPGSTDDVEEMPTTITTRAALRPDTRSSSTPETQPDQGEETTDSSQDGSPASPAGGSKKPGSEKDSSERSQGVSLASPAMGKYPDSGKNSSEVKTTTTTPPPRPTPPYTLTCVMGPYMKESTVFPEDGLCGYIMLDWLPAAKAADLAGPFAPNVKRFLDVAASYRGTEFGVAFDSNHTDAMNELLKDPTAKTNLDALYDKRIWHFGYINTDNYALAIKVLDPMVRILKTIKDLMKNRATADHQAMTFLAVGYRERVDRVSVRDLASSFSISGTPDLFISKAHLSDPDMTYEECLILPSSFLKRPVSDSEGGSIYELSLLTAFEYASDVQKRVQGPAMSVSVGLQGRWYHMARNETGDPELGDPCGPVKMEKGEKPFDSFATACMNPAVLTNKKYNCKYIVDKAKRKVFTFDDMETLRYKLCTGKKNFTSLKMGIVAAGLEFADAEGRCGGGKTFPLLRALRSMVMFFKDHYTSGQDFEKCLSGGMAA